MGKPFCRDRASLSLCENIQIIKNISLISGPLIIVFHGETTGACRVEMAGLSGRHVETGLFGKLLRNKRVKVVLATEWLYSCI